MRTYQLLTTSARTKAFSVTMILVSASRGAPGLLTRDSKRWFGFSPFSRTDIDKVEPNYHARSTQQSSGHRKRPNSTLVRDQRYRAGCYSLQCSFNDVSVLSQQNLQLRSALNLTANGLYFSSVHDSDAD